jgi:hypothetical protein
LLALIVLKLVILKHFYKVVLIEGIAVTKL